MNVISCDACKASHADRFGVCCNCLRLLQVKCDDYERQLERLGEILERYEFKRGPGLSELINLWEVFIRTRGNSEVEDE